MSAPNAKSVVGVISDTHGPLNMSAVEHLKGVDHIVHAGDVVDPSVFVALGAIAPFTAVSGNMDGYDICSRAERTAVVEIGAATIYVLHDLSQIDLDPRAAGFSCVIHGHIHRPDVYWQDDILYLNPGSIGPSRSGRPPTLARLTIDGARLTPKIIEISD